MCSPGCRHSLCKGPGARWLSFQQPRPEHHLEGSHFLSVVAALSGTPAHLERCTELESLDLKEKPGNMSLRLWGSKGGSFVNGTICRAIPGQMGGTPPSLPSHSHGRSPRYTHVHTHQHVDMCDMTLPPSSILRLGVLLGAAPALGVPGSAKGIQSPRLLPGTDFESRKPVCPAFPRLSASEQMGVHPPAMSGSADTGPAGPGSGDTGCLLCW